MEKRFCPDCGTEIIGEGEFCPNCGRAIGVPASVAAPGQPMPQMPMGAAVIYHIPPRNTKKIWAIVGSCAAAAALITAIILIIVFSGSPAGEIIKNYRYKDIVGTYEGVATVKSISVGGDYEEIADHVNLDSEKKLERSEDDELDCVLHLTDEDLTITIQDPLFMGESTFFIDDVDFNKGRAKDSTDTEIRSGTLEDSEISVDYSLTLHEGVSRNTEYRIYGTVEIEYELVMFGIEASYSIELLIDCDK